MRMMARISSGNARMALRNALVGIVIQRGATLVAAMKLRGNEKTAPIIVPIHAM